MKKYTEEELWIFCTLLFLHSYPHRMKTIMHIILYIGRAPYSFPPHF